MSQAENKKKRFYWLIIASIVLLISLVLCFNGNSESKNNDLGTCDNPEQAFKETQKALMMLSTNVNVGIESVLYIREYEESKNLIFKKSINKKK
ncbi:hypothetical protein HNQ02_002287 [Flavobacterium sp. 7E]|uniref:hypothetical protein n=1 Tax=unclassified Flavobacterium TaxID=196869 RepID=UPI00156DC7FF|nr:MULTISPECIES: hypothetical protein [unclassified Flavobacterium]MBE0393152.1 hypothetical protein [Flavobacterium sp. PL002]NRS89361.1 hypothetical protein [Flavobacterium sp. 7E]NRT15359.1 hypothetical protein [Flavobacterium sp. 28A]